MGGARKQADQANHVTALQVGGRDRGRRPPRRSPALRVVAEVQLKDGLPPGGREACASIPRPCPYIHCSFHLWLVEGRDRQGRRHHGQVPPSVVRPATGTTCALDVAERPRSTREVAELLDVSMRRIQQITRAALRKLRNEGVKLDELLALVRR